MVKLSVVSLKKAVCYVVESVNTWNLVAKQASRDAVEIGMCLRIDC